MICSKADSNKA